MSPSKENMSATMSTPWLEKENLEKWLKTPVKDIESETNNINGYLSTMLKLTVTAQDGRIFPLLVKCRILHGTTGDIFGDTAIFRKEVEYYANITHSIHNILSEANPDDQEPVAPECYYACEDFIVFEDLRVDGFKMLNRMIGLNLEQCLLVMRTLGKFHAASAVLLERNPRALEVYKYHMFQEPQFQKSFSNMMSGLTKSLAQELETWDEEWHKYIPRLNYLASNFMTMLVDTCTRRDSDFNVLTHGDLWIYNLMFKDDPYSIRFVDFQLAAEISAAIDLNYFLYTSPNTEVRIKHIPRLIQEYHSSLSSTLNALHYKNIPSLEDIQEEIDRKAVYGAYSIIGPYAVMQNGPNSGFSFEESIITCKTPGPKMYGEHFRKNIRVALPSIINKVKFPNFVEN